jgi:hypothetical protein
MNHDGYVSTIYDSHLHQHGAFFVFSGLVSGKDFVEIRSVSQPRRVPRERPLGIFQLDESVIVGNTLPSEVSVSPAPILKEVTLYFQG